MKTVSKKLFSLLLVAVLLVSVLPFQALAATGDPIVVQFMKYNWDGTYSVARTYNMVAPTMTGNESYAVDTTAKPGWRFDGWVVYYENMGFDAVNAAARTSMAELRHYDTVFAPAYVKDNYTVSFKANMPGVADPASMSITNTKPFIESGAFPMIYDEVDGYKFGGWKYGDVNLNSTTWNTTVFDASKGITELKAIWMPENVTVTFFKWDDNATNHYSAVARIQVPYGTTVKASDIPSKTDVDTKSSFEPVGWQTTAGSDAVAVDPAYTTITGDTNFYARYLGDEVTITLDPIDTKLNPITKTVRMGEKLGSYGGVLPTPTLTGYTFNGWYYTHPTTNQAIYVDNNTIYDGNYRKLKADWEEQAQVRLLVYKDGNTTTPIVSRLIPGGIVNGNLDVDSIAISSYLPSGATYKLTGYFDKAGWTDYVMNGIVSTVDNVRCGGVGVTEVYAMVETVSTNTGTGNNTGTGSGSGNTGSGNNTGSNKPADPTNPATGDNSMIVPAMTVMSLSAAALVVFMQLRKRKMF